MAIPQLKDDYIVEKRNALNEMKARGWSLQELRFLSIYLSKINARVESTRIVRFSLEDFRNIMDLKRAQVKDIKPTIDSLLSKIAYVPLDKKNSKEGFTAFQLFNECTVSKDDCGEWYVEINAHDKALPLMFDFKEYYKYPLWNILRLSSKNQHRMYEILKQYEAIGTVTIKYGDLKELLGIEPSEYVDKTTGKHRWDNFKTRVLNECQKVLAQATDIKYTYVAERKEGLEKRITFTISSNKDYTNQLCFDEVMDRFDATGATEKDDYEKGENRTNAILRSYQSLQLSDKFGKLTNDEYLAINQTAVDYMMQANRTNDLELVNIVEYVIKQALYTNRQKPTHYYNYLLTAVKNNYAEA